MGETIDITQVLSDIKTSAIEKGWHFEPFYESQRFSLFALRRCRSHLGSNLYISTGIHGDEPAGPLAVLQLIREDAWPEGVDVWLCPCLNPTGFQLNRRENADGFDLNRQYHRAEAVEVAAHLEWLQKNPKFDLAICLHEDWESEGFYLYELNPDQKPTHAMKIIQEVAKVCPIDYSEEIEGRPAHGGIIHPSTDPRSRPEWPEAFYLLTHKTRHSYTLEAPSDFPLPVRVAAHVTAVKTVLNEIALESRQLQKKIG